MTAVVRTTLAAVAAWASLVLAAAPVEARIHHHHHAAAVAAGGHHRHHGPVAAPVTGHGGPARHGRRHHSGAAAVVKGHHRRHGHGHGMAAPRSSHRHAALCQTVMVRHHMTQRCRG